MKELGLIFLMKPQNASQALPKASNKDLKCSNTTPICWLKIYVEENNRFCLHT